MIENVFWTSLLIIIYTYVGFPLLIFLRSKLMHMGINVGNILPQVTMIIVAHNEEKGIAKKIENILQLDYPPSYIDYIIASDGSDDKTNSIVKKYAEKNKNLKLIVFPRQGKIPVLNEAVKKASGKILFFSDANSLLKSNALKKLVQNFEDPSIGGVAGNQCYIREDQPNVADTGERTLWNFDQKLKQFESDAGNIISATGAIYAIRKELFEPVPLGVGDDAVISYRVIANGYRMVYESSAIAFEPVASSEANEFQRKVRVCLRGLRGLFVEPRLFNPFKYGFYSIQLLSHKLFRWIMIWPLAALLITSFFLSFKSQTFLIIMFVQLVFYGTIPIVLLLRKSKISKIKIFKIFTFPFFFCMTNFAFFIAQIHFVRGRRIDAWQVHRE